MTIEMIILRILHIVPGTVWVGSAVFLAVILEPAMRKAGPQVGMGLGPHLVSRIFRVVLTSALITIVFGLVLVDRTPGRDFGQLFTNNWGWMIGFGLITSVVAFATGLTTGLTMNRVVAIGRSLEGPPSPEQGAELARLQTRARITTRITATLVVVAVGLMASARFA